MSVFFVTLIGLHSEVKAQDIRFGEFYDSNTLNIFYDTEEGNLDFGIVFHNTTKEINIGDPEQGFIEIEGIAFLDVVVTFTIPSHLLLDGEPCTELDQCAMVLNLQKAYNNRTTIEDINSAILISTPTVLFPLRPRVSGPPVPPTPDSGQVFPTATAYLYFFGSLSIGENQTAGDYSNTVEIEVSYY